MTQLEIVRSYDPALEIVLAARDSTNGHSGTCHLPNSAEYDKLNRIYFYLADCQFEAIEELAA